MKKGKMILWALLLIVFWVVAIGVWVLFGDKTNMYYTDRITGEQREETHAALVICQRTK